MVAYIPKRSERFVGGDLPYSTIVADLNGDGLLDVVTLNGSSDDVSILLGNGDGTYQDAQYFAAGRFPATVTVVDINGDGKPDLVTGDTFPVYPFMAFPSCCTNS
jgi:FG-GAP-like repeat